MITKRREEGKGMDLRGEVGYDTSNCVDNWDDPPVRWTVVVTAPSLISGEINVARRRKFSSPAIQEHMMPGNRRRRLPGRRRLAVGVPFHAILQLNGSERRWRLAVIDDPVDCVSPPRRRVFRIVQYGVLRIPASRK